MTASSPSLADPTDPRFDVLAHGFESGAIDLPDEASALFLGATSACLARLPERAWLCEQSFKPDADALEACGFCVGRPAEGETFALVLVLPTRQREHMRAMLARALRHCAANGTVAVAMANATGARSGEADLRVLAGAAVRTLSKSKCRLFWIRRDEAAIDRDRLAAWLELDHVQPTQDGRFVSRPGLFAWDRVDTASTMLAHRLPTSLSGRAADLGAGYGYLAAVLIERCPAITSIDLFEADARALEPARINLERCGRGDIEATVHWHDVAQSLPRRYDVIVSNPPFHRDRADRPDLGRAFIHTAAGALARQGEFWLVANRHLPYEATLNASFACVQTVAEEAGFKVIRATEARR